MKKNILLLLCIAFFCLATNAQTKRIAHRSHSGNAINYSIIEDNHNLGNIDPEDYFQIPKELDSFYKTQDSLRKRDSILWVRRLHRQDSLMKLHNSKQKNK